MSVPTPILQYNLSDASVKGLLPSGYTPLAYIESTTSNQYIDTGFKYSSGDITVDCEYTVPSNSDATIFGSSNNNTKWLCLIYKSGSNSLHYCGTISGGWANSELSGNKRKITYSISGTTCTLNDGKLSVSLSCGTIPAQTYSYTLWCHHYSNTFTQYAQNARIYYFRLIYQGNLTLDYRPARRDSDGVIGMYDLVSRTFKTNSGSGTFIAGPELAVGKGGGKSLPEEYLLVEYLYNEDKTSWINFNRTLKSNTIMKVNMQVASYSTGAVYQQVMGYATNTTWKPYSLGIYNNAFILYSGTVDSTALPTSNFRQVIWTNSEETAETSGSTLGLFHMAGSPGNYANAGIKVQCCQILEGSSIIIKAFPCYRKSDMKPGMYDVVNGVFYTNAGSGEFILGPSITNCYTSEPNAGSGTLQGLYINCNSIYDANKGWCLSGNDSTYSYVEFPKEVINPLMTAKTFTIAFWFRVHNTNRHILFGSNSNYPLNIEYYTSGTKTRYYFAGSPDKVGSTTIATNTWYHVALCVTSTGFTAYINGNVDASHTSAPTLNQFTTNCRIGSDTRDTQIYLGSDILNFMVFNTALTAAQVKELYGK